VSSYANPLKRLEIVCIEIDIFPLKLLSWIHEFSFPNSIDCIVFGVVTITLEVSAMPQISQSVLVSIVELPVSAIGVSSSVIKVKEMRTFVVHEVRKTIPVDILPVIAIV